MSDWSWEEWTTRSGTHAENVKMYHEFRAEHLRGEISDLTATLHRVELYLAHPHDCGHCQEPMVLQDAFWSKNGPGILYRCPLCHRVQWRLNIGTDRECFEKLSRTRATIEMERERSQHD